MASPYLKRGTWYLRWKDDAGRWRGKACGARTKAEAKELQGQLERRAERVRLGVETGLPEDGGGTLAELFRWWLETYSKPLASHVSNESAIRVHFFSSDLGSLRLTAVTPGRVESFSRRRRASSRRRC
jgi:integrase